ncbi:MAG: hypothetical protein NZ821_01835 [Gloeomargarita sp. SKYB31]|nr:hypothetical protein [Gloeomargarita sp. SKYB31]
MAKRRNPKKEKALRNRAYARRFSRKVNSHRRGRLMREPAPETEPQT